MVKYRGPPVVLSVVLLNKDCLNSSHSENILGPATVIAPFRGHLGEVPKHLV